MKNNMLVKILAVIFLVCFTLACENSIMYAKATTHNHIDSCFQSISHTHDAACGNINVLEVYFEGDTSFTCAVRCSGCMQVYYGTEVTWVPSNSNDLYTDCIICGKRNQISVKTFYYGHSCYASGVYKNLYTDKNGCGATYTRVTGSGSETFERSCGKAEGTFLPKMHEHVGSENAAGGCYGGTYTTKICGSTGGNIEANGYYGVCGCGYTTGYVTRRCTKCRNPYYHIQHWCSQSTWSQNMASGACYVSLPVYEVICGKDANTWEYLNSILATPICNKKINIIAPKSKTQTIVR